jgi:hypothetical protein
VSTEQSELEKIIREYITNCTDEQLDEIAPHIVKKADGHEDAEELGIKWDIMNDEVDAEDLRRYIADYWVNDVECVTTSVRLFKHCWGRLYETLECQGYRRTPKGLIHPSDM